MMDTIRVQANGLNFNVLHWRPEAKNQQALCLHGLGYNAQFWRLVGPILAGAGVEVFAPDARGHGLSDKPSDGYDIHTQTSDFLALAHSLNLTHPCLIGHSWGGLQALDYCVSRGPDDPSPSGLILIDGGFGQFDQIPGASLELVISALSPPDWEGKSLAELEERLNRPDRRWIPRGEARQAFLANFEIHGDQTISPHLSLERFQELLGHIYRYPTFAKFKNVDCPVLIIAVRLTPPLTLFEQAHQFFDHQGVEVAQESLADVSVRWIDGVHELPLQQPDELGQLIVGFMRDLEQREI